MPDVKPMRSILKWAGGKHRLIPRLTELMPKGKRFVEPFVGSGVVFLNLDYPKYLLGETNPDLMILYQVLQKADQRFIRYCRNFFVPENNCQSVYLEMRARFNSTQDPKEKAALFLYLNRHGYNGLCRYNLSGIYNVPFGQMKKPFFPEDRVKLLRERLKVAKLQCQDFTKTMTQAKVGDVVYCDPPYVPLSTTANFRQYSGNHFGDEQQAELAELARSLSKRGIPVLISNHDTEVTRELYRHAKITSFPVTRTISCNGAKRKPAQELIAVFQK